MPKVTLVAVIRNQAPYILEWVAHHLALGAENFVLCVHGSSDGTAKMTRRLAAMGYAAHLKIAVEQDDPSASALAQIAALEEVTSADWIGLLSLDHYLNIHDGRGGLADLVEMAGEGMDALDISALPFGASPSDNGLEARVTETCIVRASSDMASQPSIRLARSLRSLIAPEQTRTIGLGQAQINHYHCRTQEHLAMQLTTPLYRDEAQILAEWNAQNQRAETDETIRRYDGWFEKYVRFLHADRGLRLAQKAAVAWHQTRAEQARADERLAQMLAEIEA